MTIRLDSFVTEKVKHHDASNLSLVFTIGTKGHVFGAIKESVSHIRFRSMIGSFVGDGGNNLFWVFEGLKND